ncbi:MAG: molecular chaperone TorD family protein [Desulfitobacterium hafniense]|nr:molecular chaperone TorD family protein [Desulfitobacterium hafniense]
MIANSDEVISYTQKRLTIYKFLAYVINTLPDQEFTKEIASLKFDWVSETDYQDALDSGAFWLRQFINENSQRDIENLSTTLAVEWTLLFRGIKPGYGPPPARASAYRLYDVSFLTEFYHKMGLELARSRFDPDYLGCQLAFLYELVQKELDHWKNNNYQIVEDLLVKEKYFISTHLNWVSDFLNDAEKFMSTSFYKGVLLLLEEFIAEDVQWLEYVLTLIPNPLSDIAQHS